MITPVDEKTLFSYFDVNHDKVVTYISPILCEEFIIDNEKYINKNVLMLIKNNEVLSKVDELALENKVIFAKINEHPCLIKLTSLDDEGYRFNIILKQDDIESHDILNFWKSLNPEITRTRATHDNTHRYGFENMIGNSSALQNVINIASRVAKSKSTILITGESGTGKELFAQSIHDLSPRRDGPFVAINCAAIPEELFESELFGYEGGAFSGARREGKAGKIELAQNGTLFLDEISELPLSQQGKILRVLQEREVERIGATGSKYIDIRIIAATNKDLRKQVQKKKFREDLYYRLKVFELRIPPLRERREDIIPLVMHFIRKYNQLMNLNVQYIDQSLEKKLMSYSWPGNVRELQAAIEGGMNVATGDTIYFDDVKHFFDISEDSEPMLSENLSLDQAVENAEKTVIKKALKLSNGDRMEAAYLLNIHLASLYRKIRKYDLK